MVRCTKHLFFLAVKNGKLFQVHFHTFRFSVVQEKTNDKWDNIFFEEGPSSVEKSMEEFTKEELRACIGEILEHLEVKAKKTG